jgi:hypothetical protein
MKKDVYEDFLKIAGFEGDDIPKFLPEWREASEKLGLTEEDVRFATEERIPQNYDITLRGVRKQIGAIIREAIDLTKANEYKKNGVKVVYGILPAIVTNYLAIKESGGDKVYVSFPDLFLVMVLNGYFHKIDPYLETAETEGGVSYGCRHCALNKTRLAARMKGIIPSPDITWAWGFNCDEGPKMDEYINCYYDPDWRFEITRLPHDTYFGEVDDENEERVKYLAQQLKDSCDRVGKAIGIDVTPESLSKAVKAFQRFAHKVGQLQPLAFAADPVILDPLTGMLVTSPLNMPFNTGMSYMEEAIDILIKELSERSKKGEGILPKGSPRIGSYIVPFPNPWISKMFRENGVAITYCLVGVLSKQQLKPIPYKDPYMAAAVQWLRMPDGMNMGNEIERDCELIETYKPDDMIMGFFDFDRWLGAHQKMVAKVVEERTKVPHYYLESDIWEDRDYSPEALRTRIESICQIIKMRKMTGK